MSPNKSFAAAPLAGLENGVALLTLALMVVLPLLELFLRTVFSAGLTGATEYVQHLALWVGFAGAVIAAREGQHLSLSSGFTWLPQQIERFAKTGSALVSTAVATLLGYGAIVFVRMEHESAAEIGALIPVWMTQLILPASFALIAFHVVWRNGRWSQRALAALGLPLAWAVAVYLAPHASQLTWVFVGALLVFAFLGAPLFVVLGGIALALFFSDGISPAAIPLEAYRIVVSSSIPAIPLFTLAGFVLAESQTSRRLVRLFRALFGWLPGGLVTATTLVCAFFSTFTGASGVTILALGGLLLPVLVKNGFTEKFSTGLLTATGSIGLLFPPSLAVILYAVVAHVPIPDLFRAGLVPGLIMVAAVAGYGIWQERGTNHTRNSFDGREAWAAIQEAKWEIALPVLVLFCIFGGLTSLIEAAAITAAYALVSETVIHRDLRFADLPHTFRRCAAMLGGIFIILGVAMGLTNYLVDAMVPMRAAKWVAANVESKIVFLLALNVFLLIVGALMDIFSAIVVVVPLIIPIAEVFKIDPLHLGMIFLVNLELGYLTPPVGMNLFLASYRFNKPLLEVYRAAVPFLVVLLCVVALITYVPSLIVGVH